MNGRAAAPWALALAGAGLALALTGYRARDADSRLYAQIAADMSRAPAAGWIAPEFPPGWFMSGRFREHPVGLFLPAALLARLGYPAPQAAYALNAVYQVLSLVLLQRLAAAVVPGLEARALGWLVQLLPIAFVYRIRANQEQAVLLCLLLALYGVERARRSSWFSLLTAAGLVGLLLVKGLLAAFGPAACALWLLARRAAAPRDERGDGAAWAGLAASVAAMGAAALLYEHLYRLATGEAFWSLYAARQMGVAFPSSRSGGLFDAAAGLAFYSARLLWFAFPWSLVGLFLLLRPARKAPLGRPPEPERRAGLLFAVGLTLLYVVAFSLSARRADRYVFPAYYAVGAAGAVLALSRSVRLRAAAERLDRPWVAPAVWAATFAAHLVAGRLGLPTFKA
jgi:hypothetical protein